MEPTPSNSAPSLLGEEDARAVLQIATDSISHTLTTGRQIQLDTSALSSTLRADGASFVTLQIRGRLRGCIGTLQARQPLALDVAENAFNAAFRDPRFPPVTAKEFPQLDIHISVLSPMEPMSFTSEEDFLSQLRPGVDGLEIEEGRRRGTFLPSVWEELRDPREFLMHLKMKAGMSPDYWSKSIRAYRYTTQYIP